MKVGYRVIYRHNGKLRDRLFLNDEHNNPEEVARQFAFKQKVYGHDYRLEKVFIRGPLDYFLEGHLVPFPTLLPRLRIPLIYVVAVCFVCYATYYLVRH